MKAERVTLAPSLFRVLYLLARNEHVRSEIISVVGKRLNHIDELVKDAGVAIVAEDNWFTDDWFPEWPPKGNPEHQEATLRADYEASGSMYTVFHEHEDLKRLLECLHTLNASGFTALAVICQGLTTSQLGATPAAWQTRYRDFGCLSTLVLILGQPVVLSSWCTPFPTGLEMMGHRRSRGQKMILNFGSPSNAARYGQIHLSDTATTSPLLLCVCVLIR